MSAPQLARGPASSSWVRGGQQPPRQGEPRPGRQWAARPEQGWPHQAHQRGRPGEGGPRRPAGLWRGGSGQLWALAFDCEQPDEQGQGHRAQLERNRTGGGLGSCAHAGRGHAVGPRMQTPRTCRGAVTVGAMAGRKEAEPRRAAPPPGPGHVPGGAPVLSLLAAPSGLDLSYGEGQGSRQTEPRVPWTNQSCLWPTGAEFQLIPCSPRCLGRSAPRPPCGGGLGGAQPCPPLPRGTER